jgi:hypothetical protein
MAARLNLEAATGEETMFTVMHRDRGGDMFYRAIQLHYWNGALHGLAGPEEAGVGNWVGHLNSGEVFIISDQPAPVS